MYTSMFLWPLRNPAAYLTSQLLYETRNENDAYTGYIQTEKP